MSEINIQIRDADTFECEGKTYRAVGFWSPLDSELFYSNVTDAVVKASGDRNGVRLIVTEVKPLHRTPTDEDAKRRPACEYRDRDDHDWRGNTMDKLLYVAPHGQFIVLHSNGECVYWNQCRIPNES